MKIIFNPNKDEKGVGLTVAIPYKSKEFIDAISRIADLADCEEITALEIQKKVISVRIGRK